MKFPPLLSMNAVQRGNARLQAGMLVPGPFYRRQGIDSFAFRLSLLKLRFPSNRAFPVPAPEKLQEKTEGFLSCAERAVPRIFLFLGMEVSPEFEKLLQDGLRDVFSIRPACLFFYSFPMAGACPGKNPVSRILIAGKCSSQPLPEPCIAAYWEAGRAQIRKRERKNSRGSLNSKGKFVQGETRFFHP